MIVVPAETRTFPLASVPVLSAPLDDLFGYALQVKRANCPQWTDESASDFGVQLLWLFAVMARWNVDNMQRMADNNFIPTTMSREAMRRLCEPLLYDLAEARSARTPETINCAAGHPGFTIPKNTQLATQQSTDQSLIIFEVEEDTVVLPGVTSATAIIVEGKTTANEVLGSSEGLTSQVFTLSSRTVVWQSESVEVFDGSVWESWTRVTEFSQSSSDSKHYRIAADETGLYYIVFGDGTFGKVPVRGLNNIRATYRVGGGVRGNVAANTINQIITPITYILSVNNAEAATGGVDRETLDHARIASRAHQRAFGRAVSAADYEYWAENFVSPLYGSIAVAKAINSGGSKIQVAIVPISGELPSSGLKADLEAFLATKGELCVSVSVIDPVYQPINVTSAIYCKPGFGVTTVESNVRSALTAILSPTYRDAATGLYPNKIGRSIYLADLYQAIMQAEGVHYCVITLPTTDTILIPTKCATLGVVTLTLLAA